MCIYFRQNGHFIKQCPGNCPEKSNVQCTCRGAYWTTLLTGPHGSCILTCPLSPWNLSRAAGNYVCLQHQQTISFLVCRKPLLRSSLPFQSPTTLFCFGLVLLSGYSPENLPVIPCASRRSCQPSHPIWLFLRLLPLFWLIVQIPKMSSPNAMLLSL